MIPNIMSPNSLKSWSICRTIFLLALGFSQLTLPNHQLLSFNEFQLIPIGIYNIIPLVESFWPELIFTIMLFLSAFNFGGRLVLAITALLGVYYLGFQENFGPDSYYHDTPLPTLGLILIAFAPSPKNNYFLNLFNKKINFEDIDCSLAFFSMRALLALSFTIAGVNKLQMMGFDWISSNHFSQIMQYFSIYYLHPNLETWGSQFAMQISNIPVLMKSIAGLFLFLQLTAVVSLFTRRGWLLWWVPIFTLLFIGTFLFKINFAILLPMFIFWYPFSEVKKVQFSRSKMSFAIALILSMQVIVFASKSYKQWPFTYFVMLSKSLMKKHPLYLVEGYSKKDELFELLPSKVYSPQEYAWYSYNLNYNFQNNLISPEIALRRFTKRLRKKNPEIAKKYGTYRLLLRIYEFDSNNHFKMTSESTQHIR
jgi:hypothetical protein